MFGKEISLADPLFSACRCVALVATALLISAANLAGAVKAAEGDTVRIGVVVFLSGPAAESVGVPARQGLELMIDAINGGGLPAPFDTPGVGGAHVEPIFVDETGAATKMVTEFRNLVERREVDLVLGYTSTANCNAVAPVADELKMLTVFAICAAPVFEKADFKYVFQTVSPATAHAVGLARLVEKSFPEAMTVAGIHPNYAWGRDAWGAFLSSIKVLRPGVEAVNEQWPKLFAGQYNAEISSLLISRPDIIHTSLWGGDLQSFILQAVPRGLFEQSRVMFSVGLHILPIIGDQLPDGTIVTTLGQYGQFMPESEISRWFMENYRARYGSIPGTVEGRYAEAMLAVKAAYDKAAATVERVPNMDEVVEAFEYLTWNGLTGEVSMALGNGHQAIMDMASGYTKFDPELRQSVVTEIVRFDAQCVNPPPGWKSLEWIEAGFPGAKCD